MSNAPSTHDAILWQWEKRAFLAGCVALGICVIGAFLGGAAQFFRAYMAAYMYCWGIAMGSMAILMVSHLTGGAWAYLTRRILESQMATLPLLAVLFLPLALGLKDLYVWARPELVAADAKLQAQQFYLNPSFFLIRAAIYFALWIVLALALIARSRRQERTGDVRLPWKFMRLSEVGLVLFGTSMHFAAFDWIEMLQPTYHSTIFPMLVTSSQLFSAQAFSIVVLILVSLRYEAGSVVSTPGSHRPGQHPGGVPHHLCVHDVVPIHVGMDCQPACGRALVHPAGAGRLAGGGLGLVPDPIRRPAVPAANAGNQIGPAVVPPKVAGV